MNKLQRAIAGVAATGVLLGSIAGAPSVADAAVKPKVYKNCTALNKVYPHGVAKNSKVKDKVRGKTKPVTTFTVKASVYKRNDGKKKKYKHERDLDRDNDGIVCEKR